MVAGISNSDKTAQMLGLMSKKQQTQPSEEKTDAFSSVLGNSSETQESQAMPAGQLGQPTGMNLGENEESTEDFGSMISSLINKMINKYDLDGDGVVTQEEIEKAKGKEKPEDETREGTEKPTDISESETNLSSVFIQKLLAGYKEQNDSLLQPTISNVA